MLVFLSLPLAGCSQFDSLVAGKPFQFAGDHSTPASNKTFEVVEEASYGPSCTIDPEEYSAYPGPAYANLWDRIRAGFKLEYEDHTRIEHHRNWYARNPTYMERVSKRGARYLYSIVEKLEERDMPVELALLPIVESAFDPFAYSHGRASGIWQFIPSTGLHYGLKQNWWYDGRRDIEASTDAALDYLSTLHGYFDDWLLALAAYNTGQGNLRKAIRRNKRAGKPTDFWSLDLPRETRAYVPQLLALSQLVANPDDFDLALNPIPNRRYYDVVKIDSQIDLAKAAELAEMDIDDLYLLNPGFNRWATDPNGPHRLLIPTERKTTFVQNLEDYPQEERLAWQTYEVRPGDSLARLARRFNTTVNTLRDVNQLRGSLIRQGQSILIPTASNNEDFYALSAEQRRESIQNGSGNRQGKKISYQVQRGDSFWEISRRYGVGVKALAKWNGMAPLDPLRVGQTLVIWSEQSTPTKANTRRDRRLMRELAYRVRRGDSLARIADKFNLSVQDIAAWNSLEKQDYIHPGQQLKLIVDITSTH